MTGKIAAFFLICLSVALVAVSLPAHAQPASKNAGRAAVTMVGTRVRGHG